MLVKNIFLGFVSYFASSLTHSQQRKSGSRIGLNVTRLLPRVTVFLILLGCYSAALAQVAIQTSVKTNQNAPSYTISSPSLSTSASNELLLALIATDDVGSTNTRVQSVTGAGLTWILVDRTNKESGTAEIWRAFAPSLLKNVTVAASLSQSVVSSMTIVSFTGVPDTGTFGSGAIGAVASGYAPNGAPAARLTTTQNGSLVVGVGNDYDNAIARTPLAGQTVIHQDLSPTQDTYWVQQLNASVPAKGTTVNLGDSAPTTDRYNLSICEVLSGVPTLRVSASSLNFGTVTDGTTATQTLTLKSTGTDAVTIKSDSINGTGFSISSSTLPATLSPGQSITLQVSFHPSVAGTASGTISISSNSSGVGTSTVSLSGTGSSSQLKVSASAIAFGNVDLNAASTKTLTLTGSGTTALTVNSAKLTGAAFSIKGATFPVKLSPGQTVTLQVGFDPTVAGAASGTITISSTSSISSTNTVSLSGTGVSPQLTMSANSLTFDNVMLKTTSTKILTLTSSGTAAVTVKSAVPKGTGFSVSGATFPATLNPGQTLTLQVGFDPTVAGAASGTITISSTSSISSTNTVSLSGTGVSPQLTMSANSLTFGNVMLKTTSTKTLTLTSSGTAAVTVKSAVPKGTGFSVSGATFPDTLNPGQTLTLQVGFDPTVAGAASGTITISSTSSISSTNTVSLSGTGINSDPVLTLSSNSLNFGSDPVGTALRLPVSLTSTGTSAVTVSAASIAGAGFSFSGATFPVTLNPNIAVKVQVQFDPTSAGTVSGKLSISSNSTSGSTSVVNLSGIGTSVQHEVSLIWVAPTKSPVPVSGYNIYRATGNSTSFLRLDASEDTQTDYVDTNVVARTTYSYYVTSVDSKGIESGPSNQVTFTVP